MPRELVVALPTVGALQERLDAVLGDTFRAGDTDMRGTVGPNAL